MQEILIGMRGGVTAFVTEKTKFKARDMYTRLGARLTVKHEDEYHPLPVSAPGEDARPARPRGFAPR
jgi:hypothetical protein